jgi:hypothetical protein
MASTIARLSTTALLSTAHYSDGHYPDEPELVDGKPTDNITMSSLIFTSEVGFVWRGLAGELEGPVAARPTFQFVAFLVLFDRATESMRLFI